MLCTVTKPLMPRSLGNKQELMEWVFSAVLAGTRPVHGVGRRGIGQTLLSASFYKEEQIQNHYAEA